MADVLVYALSTCGHCRNLKRMLNENNVPYECHEVDLANGDERQSLIEQVKRLNPSVSFPTVVINGQVFVGFREKAIREALGL